MKVLQIINSLDTGGAEKLLLDTVPLFNKKGIQMDVLVFNDNNSLFLKQLKSNKCCKIISLNSKSLFNPKIILKLITYFKKYDIFHVHLFPAQYWVIIAKIVSFSSIKILFTEHSTSNRRRNSYFFKIIDKLIYSHFDYVICISNGVYESLINSFATLQNKARIILNGIDFERYQSAVPLLRSQIDSNILNSDKLLIQVSQFRSEKDQITTIKSMKYLPNNFKLLLVGDGQLRNKCQILVSKLNLNQNVFFLGSRNDVERLLKSSDVAILSSHWEGFGLAAVESMASGIPVVASDVSGLSDVVKGAGVLFESGNPKELSDKIKELCYDVNHYIQISKSCQIRAKDFDVNIMVENTIKLYKEIYVSKKSIN